MLTLYGACAVTFMMLMYALESRGPAFILTHLGRRPATIEHIDRENLTKDSTGQTMVRAALAASFNDIKE